MTLTIGFNATYNQNEVTKLLITDDPNYIGVTYGTQFYRRQAGDESRISGQIILCQQTGL